MYLELLDKNKTNKAERNMIMLKTKVQKRDWEDVRSTWLDQTASEGIQLQTLTLVIFFLLFLFEIVQHLSKGKKVFYSTFWFPSPSQHVLHISKQVLFDR